LRGWGYRGNASGFFWSNAHVSNWIWDEGFGDKFYSKEISKGIEEKNIHTINNRNTCVRKFPLSS